jgi:hypothetical protein
MGLMLWISRHQELLKRAFTRSVIQHDANLAIYLNFYQFHIYLFTYFDFLREILGR